MDGRIVFIPVGWPQWKMIRTENLPPCTVRLLTSKKQHWSSGWKT